ncbi:MAG: cysteine hydrolase [Chloroflexi bacterium]|nr:cysteine hydrolase [Chloroflexota bacterium]
MAQAGDRVPFTIDIARTALIVVDMQNDFVRVGAPQEVPDARTTIPVIRSLLDRFHALERPVVYTRFLAGPAETLMWRWSPELAPPRQSCWLGVRRTYGDVEGEREGPAVIDELTPTPGDSVIDKYGYGAFHRTRLHDLLLAHGVDTVVVVGTVTQICVDETVRGAFELGLRAVLVEDGVSSFDPALHDATIRNVAMKFGRVMTAAELLTELPGT